MDPLGHVEQHQPRGHGLLLPHQLPGGNCLLLQGLIQSVDYGTNSQMAVPPGLEYVSAALAYAMEVALTMYLFQTHQAS